MNKKFKVFNVNKVEPNSVVARVFLAFLATAGLFYINIMPALVNGLIEGLGFSAKQAGFVSSANLYGASVGALLAVFLIKRINWRVWSYTLLLSIFVIDYVSTKTNNVDVLVAIRSFHGLTGGLLVGIGFCIISRTLQPDKTFGYLLFIQWGLGGLGLMLLPGLVPVYGVSALFYALMMFTLATSIMLPFLPDYNVDENNNESSKNELPVSKSNIKLLMLSLLAIFLFQGANMGLFAYMIDLGKANNLTIDFMSPSLAMASWIALLGAFVVMVLGNKYGRVLPVVVGTLITALCSWLLHFSGLSMVYAVANIVIGIMWAFVLPFLFGMCSEFDKTGQFAALGGFASKMGLASGPMLAAFLVSNDTYDVVINISTLLLIAATLVALIPARELDRQE